MTDKKDLHEHDHECGDHCDHDHDEDMEIIYLNLEDGTDVECGILGVFEVEDKEYMALWAIEEDEVLLFAYEEEADEFELLPIEDDDEFEIVSQAYYALFSDDDEFEEYDEED